MKVNTDSRSNRLLLYCSYLTSHLIKLDFQSSLCSQLESCWGSFRSDKSLVLTNCPCEQEMFGDCSPPSQLQLEYEQWQTNTLQPAR
ncbi:escape protein 2 [Fusarium oxysporum f. sp. albedinis]|nr:escape protein 2 [Fusarium oxysporum f. sp. albedinis]